MTGAIRCSIAIAGRFPHRRIARDVRPFIECPYGWWRIVTHQTPHPHIVWGL